VNDNSKCYFSKDLERITIDMIERTAKTESQNLPTGLNTQGMQAGVSLKEEYFMNIKYG
jgi:hypothetical protein